MMSAEQESLSAVALEYHERRIASTDFLCPVIPAKAGIQRWL